MPNKTLWFCKAYKFQVEVLAKHLIHSDLKFFLFGLINTYMVWEKTTAVTPLE